MYSSYSGPLLILIVLVVKGTVSLSIIKYRKAGPAKAQAVAILDTPNTANPLHVTSSKNKLGCLQFYHRPVLSVVSVVLPAFFFALKS
jgi:hypothetical protein